MISDDQLQALEHQALEILEQAGWTGVAEPDEERTEAIIHRACLEASARESTPPTLHETGRLLDTRRAVSLPCSPHSGRSPEHEACSELRLSKNP